MTKTLYAIFKNGKFIEAAYCIEYTKDNVDEADAYVRLCERKYGLKDFKYKWGKQAEESLPKGYAARTFYSRPTKGNRKMNEFIAKFKHAEDDGVNYE